MSESETSPFDDAGNFTRFNNGSISIGDYQRRLSERKKHEEKKKLEEQFLRKSLRHSDKFRALASSKRIAKGLAARYKGEENPAFSGDGMVIGGDEIDNPQWDVPEFLHRLRRTLERRKFMGFNEDLGTSQLNDAEWDWLQKTISDKTVLQAFNLHDTIARALEFCRIKNNGASFEDWAVGVNGLSELEAVTGYLSGLQEDLHSQDISKLLAIFSKPTVKNLIAAHDGVAGFWANEAQRRTAGDADDKDSRGKPTAYISPVEGCYKILAVDDHGEAVPPTNGTVLVNVVLQKREGDFLGATARMDGSAIVIGRIVSGGLIERSGLLNEGDELLSANGIDLTGRDVDYVADVLTSLSGQIVLLVAPAFPISAPLEYSSEPLANLRALFTYNPGSDRYNPCPEAGLSFDKGDILRVLATRDPNWWQALRIEERGSVGVTDYLAGLIPSPFFQRQRSAIRLQTMCHSKGDYESDASDCETQWDSTSSMIKSTLSLHVSSTTSSVYSNRVSTNSAASSISEFKTIANDLASADPVWSLHGYGPKQIRRAQRAKEKSSMKFVEMLKKRKRASPKSEKDYCPSPPLANIGQTDEDQLKWIEAEAIQSSVKLPSLLTYEPVELFYPQPVRRRPLIFVGPAHAGRQRIIDGLIAADPKRFAFPDIHTTHTGIISTKFQHFEVIQKEEFQQMQKLHEFVEWGVFNYEYYGTTISSVEKLVRSGKVCLMSLRPDSIRAIRRTPFLPCIVFISPPESLEIFRTLPSSICDQSNCSDDELTACMEQCKNIEEHYGHFFEFFIVPDAQASPIQELRSIALELERKPQWVPVHWISLADAFAAKAATEAGLSVAKANS